MSKGKKWWKRRELPVMVRWVWFKVTLLSKQRHYFANKSLYSQSYGSSSSHAWMWELDHNESWAPKNWCFWIVVLEKSLESPLDSNKIKLVNPKVNQPWILRTEIWKDWKLQYFGHLMQKLTHWKIPWFGVRLKAKGGGGGVRECNSKIASPTQWMWIWANSGR